MIVERVVYGGRVLLLTGRILVERRLCLQYIDVTTNVSGSTIHGNPCMPLDIHVGIHGFPWKIRISRYPVISRNFWKLMNIPGYPWISMDFYEYQWISTNIQNIMDFLWKPKNQQIPIYSCHFLAL